MVKQNVNIVNFNSLYKILEEIKDNLSFDIKNCQDENIFLKQYEKNIKNSLIVTNHNTKNLDKKNVLILNNFPIEIKKLVESINISLIKLKFNNQSKINIKSYELNLNSKIFSKNNVGLKLTEKEINIILYLSANKNKHNVIDLQRNIWGYSSELETHTVETHIYRLRKKINDKFNDKDLIVSHNEGYFIE